MIHLLLLILPVFVQDSEWPPVVEIEIRGPLVPVQANAKWHLAYELHITNLERKPMTLSKVEVVGKTAFPPETLNRNLYHPGLGRITNPRLIPAGKRVILFSWVTTDSRPQALRHRIFFENEKPLTLPEKAVPKTGSITIAPPLRGAHWMTGNGPSNLSAHRRALLPAGGRLSCSQRFAIDFVRLGENGLTFQGDRKKNESYHAYGEEILAVAAGTVVSIKDGIPENLPGIRSRAVPITPETLGGNFIVLKLAPRHYAFYAHLQPGSLRVRVGERVKAGQTLGLLGNTGNSTEPHLHFHVMQGRDPLASEGIPFTFRRYQKQGTVGDLERAWEAKGELRRKEIPLQNEILRFDLEPY